MAFPTEEQRRVIDHRGRPLVVVAGPGTGKTRTLVERMIGLCSERPQEDVCFTTFTRASRRDAARKLRDARDVLPEGDADASPTVSTLHSYARHIMYKHGRGSGLAAISVLADQHGEKATVLTELAADLELSAEPDTMADALRYYRAYDRWPDDAGIPPTRHEALSSRLCELLRFYGTSDMEGLVSAACALLQIRNGNMPPIHLQVDEYQDLNPKDQELVRLIAAHPKSEVVVVGDDAQSIYGRRHARYMGLQELWSDEAWDHTRFSDSHRLPGHILRASMALVEGRGYLGAAINAKPDDGRRVRVAQVTKPQYQCQIVARSIERLKNQAQPALTYKDFMVLCPTRRLAKSMADSLWTECGIRSEMSQKSAIPADHWRLLLVLRMVHSHDGLALRQWLPLCGVKPDRIQALRRAAMNAGESLFAWCYHVDDPETKAVYKALEAVEDALEDPPFFRRRLLEFPELHLTGQTLDMFSGLDATVGEAASGFVHVPRLIRHIYEKYGVLDTEDEVAETDAVRVTTMHAAKGLEAEYVFLTWMTDDRFPTTNDLEEERRVLYVALTRARRDVIITFHEQWRDGKCLREDAASRYLLEIRPHLEFHRRTAKDLQ